MPEGSLAHGVQTIPLSFPALTLAHGQSTTATRHRDRERAGAVVAEQPEPLPADARGRAGEQLLRAHRPAPADLARRTRVPQRLAAAPARRQHPGGRDRPRRRADARRPGRDRARAEVDRRERRAHPAPARPGAARTTGRGRHPRVAGDRPGRRRRQLVLDDARAARRSRAAGADGRARRRAAPVDLRLEPRR